MNTFKSKINKVRKTILIALTKNVGASNHQNAGLIDKDKVDRVLIIRPNHRLGNQLLMAPIVQEVLETFPHCKIDLFGGKLSPILYKNYERIDRIIKLPRKPFKELFNYIQAWLVLRNRRYDIAINVEKSSSSGRLATKFARATYKFYGEDEAIFNYKYPDYKHIAKYPVYSLRYSLSKLGIAETNKDVPVLDLKLSAAEFAEGRKILHSLIDQKEARTISLYTFATGAKCYSESWWSEFYERLKSQYPNFNILEILPVENVSMIAFKAPSYYSRDLREMGAVIANTAVFIGADCGIMHLASAVNAPTLGFFSVANAESYEPYNKNSKALTTTQLTMDDIFHEIDNVLSASFLTGIL
jgi:heptosyltransferase III